MNQPPLGSVPKKLAATLVVRPRINATREKPFAAWTQPALLVRWWEPQGVAERVTVSFAAHGAATEVVVTRERIPDEAARTSHERGWIGCLDNLVRYAEHNS